MPDNAQTIYCEYEHQEFPASEFEEHRVWGRLHRAHPLHTVRGYVIRQSQIETDLFRDSPHVTDKGHGGGKG